MRKLEKTQKESELKKIALQIRKLILAQSLPTAIKKEIAAAYKSLGSPSVAVRSSAQLEDTDTESFAGKYDSILNVTSIKGIEKAIRSCYASVFSDRAVIHRTQKGYDHVGMRMAVMVQEFVNVSTGVSGIAFSQDPDSKLDAAMCITASYGLGSILAQGRVTPDRFYLFKQATSQNKQAVFAKELGHKDVLAVTATRGGSITQEPVKKAQQEAFCMTDAQLLQVGKAVMQIEALYGQAQDIEWSMNAKGEVFVVQTRPITHAPVTYHASLDMYHLKKEGPVRLRGEAIGHQIGSGLVRIVNNKKELDLLKDGEVIVTKATSLDWESAIRKASAVITEEGGKTSHAAIMCRELGVPCIVGAKDARKELKNGNRITVSCAKGDEGIIYKGLLPYEVEHVALHGASETKTQLFMNVADPDNAFQLAPLPYDGVGLVRQEYIFRHFIGVHPLALLEPKKVKAAGVKKAIKQKTKGFASSQEFALAKLAEGMARIAVASYPRPVMVRFTDMTSSDYNELLGAEDFVKDTSLPGAGRYLNDWYEKGFALECEAMKLVREQWGLTNLIPLVPFCRTPEEATSILEKMKTYGLERGKQDLQVYVMCDIPSNVILAEEFATMFDGFSVDVDSLVEHSLGYAVPGNREKSIEGKDAIAKKLVRQIIKEAHKQSRHVSISGNTPSEFPSFADFLVQQGVDSMTLNPDVLLSSRKRVAYLEKTVGRTGTKTNKTYLSIVATFGIMMSSLLGVGAGCIETVFPAKVVERDQIVTPAQLRMQVEQKVTENLAAEHEKEQALAQKDRALPEFTLDYPDHWQVSTADGSVKFYDRDDGEYIQVYRLADMKEGTGTNASAALVGGLNGTKYTEMQGGATTTIYELATPSGDTLYVAGQAEELEEMVESIEFFFITQPNAPPSGGEEICAQVISYGENPDTGECQLFPTPCDVPDGWQSCRQ